MADDPIRFLRRLRRSIFAQEAPKLRAPAAEEAEAVEDWARLVSYRRPVPAAPDPQSVAEICSTAIDVLARSEDPDGTIWCHYAAKEAVEEAQAVLGWTDRTIRRALAAELLPWALGYGDPVRVRVANRSEANPLPEDTA